MLSLSHLPLAWVLISLFFYTTLAIANIDVRPFWWCWCVYTLCGMRPVDLRFFAYVYNVYNRKADDVFVAGFCFFCCACTMSSGCWLTCWLLLSLACVRLPARERTFWWYFSDKYVHVTQEHLLLAEVSFARELYYGKARADIAQTHCVYYINCCCCYRCVCLFYSSFQSVHVHEWELVHVVLL